MRAENTLLKIQRSTSERKKKQLTKEPSKNECIIYFSTFLSLAPVMSEIFIFFSLRAQPAVREGKFTQRVLWGPGAVFRGIKYSQGVCVCCCNILLQSCDLGVPSHFSLYELQFIPRIVEETGPGQVFMGLLGKKGWEVSSLPVSLEPLLDEGWQKMGGRGWSEGFDRKSLHLLRPPTSSCLEAGEEERRAPAARGWTFLHLSELRPPQEPSG